MTVPAAKFILGTKVGMSQIFKDNVVIPVTVIAAGPCKVVQVRNPERDGYTAVQIGLGAKRRVSKPLQGHLKDLGNVRHLKEFRVSDSGAMERGKEITVQEFQVGDEVVVSGITKGKGFQGVVKRHHFHGGPKTHGQKDRHRSPGSIGRRWPQRVTKGRKMAGHMGADRLTIKGLRVVDVIPEENLLVVRGSIPGPHGALLEIKTKAK